MDNYFHGFVLNISQSDCEVVIPSSKATRDPLRVASIEYTLCAEIIEFGLLLRSKSQVSMMQMSQNQALKVIV